MERYINVENFIKEKRELYCKDCDRRKGMSTDEVVYEIGDAPCTSCGINDILEDIEDYSTADVQEVKHGKNIGEDYASCDQFVCSNCRIELQDWIRIEREEDNTIYGCFEYEFKHCPNCGAKIDKEEN